MPEIDAKADRSQPNHDGQVQHSADEAALLGEQDAGKNQEKPKAPDAVAKRYPKKSSRMAREI